MYLLALALLLAPDLPDLPGPLPPDLYQAVKDEAELLDLWRRNSNWGYSADELRWTRRTLRATWGAPPEADACWLPSLEFIQAAFNFSERLLGHIDARMGCGGDPDNMLLIRKETSRLQQAWLAARYAREAGPNIAGRRQALARLRELIGPDAYRAGVMPPWVPVWRLNVLE